jgi:tetratricopeptide (TPR) repeat protein
MGGQGKSALAARLFESLPTLERYDHRLWRDCKEQSDKFEDHIITLIEALNDGRVLSGELSKQPIESLADLFCSLTEDLRLLVIFDNVDHYVDLERSVLVGPAGAFVTRFLSNESKATLVFTCRPSIVTTSTSMYAKRLEGLELHAVHELFNLRQASVSRKGVEEAYEKTQGHAFWLDLLAAQVAARAPLVTLESLLANIVSGGGEIPDGTLRSIWQSLRDREQIVLQALAEVLRPVSAITLSDYLQSKANFNQTSKAVRLLRSLNLLVVKRLDEGEEGFELHPVIRAFIHRTFKRSERVWFIDKILSFYDAFFGTHLAELSKRPTAMTVGRWLEGAELCVNAGHYERAFSRLNEVRSALRRNSSPVEFVRVTHRLLASIPATKWRNFTDFDTIFTLYHRCLVNFARLDDARTALEQYEETLEGKDARYINYCDMQTYMYWMNGDYLAAIKWGTDGAKLKQESGVDTPFSSEHNLALAERDSGAVDPALSFFLGGATVEEVLDPEHYDKDRGGTFYGNVGRCLQLMGQIDPALVCYGKSARLIEEEHEDSDIENQAYIRQWIGELLREKGEEDAALFFFRAALAKWSLVSPPKAVKIERIMTGTSSGVEVPSAVQAEVFALRWIKAAGMQA